MWSTKGEGSVTVSFVAKNKIYFLNLSRTVYMNVFWLFLNLLIYYMLKKDRQRTNAMPVIKAGLFFINVL